MADWATISSLATAAGTMVLAIATFSSVRSGNRAARTAERTLEAGLRPVLFASRTQDETQKIRWVDDHWARVEGGRATVEVIDGVIYLALSLRNVGTGIAVLHGWRWAPDQRSADLPAPDLDSFRMQSRDLYVPAGDFSFWQAAIREPDDPDRLAVLHAIEQDRIITIDLLYGDHEGGQRTISRFSATKPSAESTGWFCSVVRHWNIDRADPR